MTPNEITELLEVLRKAERIMKQRKGLAPDQAYLKRFIRKNYNQTESHKLMKNILVSELASKGFRQDDILVEKRPFKGYRFRPDVTVMGDGSCILFECHYHDGWGHEDICKTHLYNNIDAIRGIAKVVICVTDEFDSRKPVEKRRRKVLKAADEVWVLDLNNSCVKRKVLNN